MHTPTTFSSAFTVPGVLDTHTADWEWGDGESAAGTVDQGAGFGSVEDAHSYSAPGEYTVTLIVTDDDGATNAVEALVGIARDDTNSTIRAAAVYALGRLGAVKALDAAPTDASVKATSTAPIMAHNRHIMKLYAPNNMAAPRRSRPACR